MDTLATLLATEYNAKIADDIKEATESEASLDEEKNVLVQEDRWQSFHNNKTKSSLSVIHDLESSIEIEGTNFSLCEVGLQDDIKRLIPEPAQLCQYATATQIPYVMMIYLLPGALVKKLFYFTSIIN